MPIISPESSERTQFGVIPSVWTSLPECPLNSFLIISNQGKRLLPCWCKVHIVLYVSVPLASHL